MYAVGNRVDRHLVNIDAWPQELPHPPRDRSVQFTHAVVLSRQPQREYSHTIGRPVAVILARHLHKLIAVEPQLSPVGTKIPGNQIPASLQVEKSGVSFIDMPRGW